MRHDFLNCRRRILRQSSYQKVPREDRELLARNLGKRLERLQKAQPGISDRQVFLRAFGEADGEVTQEAQRFDAKAGRVP